MSRIISIFDSKKGQIHGYRDFRQAQEFLGLEKKELDALLWQGGGYHDGMYVCELTLHKSMRGGSR